MMAPTQKCYDVKISAPGVLQCCRCGASSKRSWDTFLPITRRGTFSQDSFFSNIRHDFDSAVRDVLSRWSNADLSLTSRRDDTDIMGRYRQLRSRNLKEENQAITVASDNTSHKIVLDVNDFVEGDVQVKVVGEAELVVEGRVDKKEEGCSSASSHSFRRRFTLPKQTDMTAITSVMSSDGILTITAPRLSEEAQQKATDIPVRVEKSQKSESSNATMNVTTEISSDGRMSKDEEECRCTRCLRDAEEMKDEAISTNSKRFNAENSSASQSREIKINEAMKSNVAEERSGGSESSFRNEQRQESVSNFGRSSFLPISRRGRFFDDSFFSDIHQDFDSAVRDVLNKWSKEDLHLRDRWDDDFRRSDVLDRYRQLRSRDLKEENQAITVASGNSTQKIVLDVHEFMGGDVKVKVVGERDLVVEGCLESKEGDSSRSSHTFRRRFSLPHNTDMTAITSVMSSDGILTITAPEKGYNVQQSTTIIPVEVQQTRRASETQSSQNSTSVTNVSNERRTLQEEKKEETECACVHCSENKESEDATVSQKESVTKVPIKILGSFANNTESRSEKVQGKTEAKESASKESKIETFSSFTNKEESDSAMESSVSKSTSRRESLSKFLPITRRGRFFNDSYFDDARTEFQRAIKDVLARWGEESSAFDDLTSYRNLRSRDLREENQAATSVEDENYHKFVIDVHDFLDGGEINVEAVNDRELVVEGRVEKAEGGSRSSRRFLRRFVVPGDIQLEAVTSVMSSDGVLTISAPKKSPTIAIKEVKVPVAIRECRSESRAMSEEKMANEKTQNQEFSVTSEKQTKSNVYNSSDESVCTSSKTSSVDTSSMLRNQESSNLEQLDRQRQVTLQENQVGGEGSLNYDCEAREESVSKESKRCSESKYLPIVRKGLFADDHFFENVRERYSEAVRDVLEKAKEWPGQMDAMQTYRNLRERNLQVENQAFSVTEDEQSHKVVMDVHDFTSGDVTVSLVGGSELVVEGQAERQEGGQVSKKSFVRRFLLPDLIEQDAITSALSSDGILTVVSRKKGGSEGLATRGFRSDVKSRVESQTDNGHSWEEKTLQESSQESEGRSVRTFATSSRAHHHHSHTTQF